MIFRPSVRRALACCALAFSILFAPSAALAGRDDGTPFAESPLGAGRGLAAIDPEVAGE